MAAILLVEDDAMNRDMLARRLEKKGHAVTPVADAAAAFVAVAVAVPDIILMDLSLPGMDGLDATRRLKAAPATAAVPVVLLTAHAGPEDRIRATAAGCDGFDTKPIDMPRLLAAITALTTRKPDA